MPFEPHAGFPRRGAAEARLGSWQTAKATFLDGDAVVAKRDVDVKISGPIDEPPTVEARLAGGRWSAADVAGRRLMCVVAPLGQDPRPCVIRTSGEIYFLPLAPPGDAAGVREPLRPGPSRDVSPIR
jgi:hypothetical protein